MICPSDLDRSRHQSSSVIEFLMNRTLPSARHTLTPAVCRLRDMAEVISVPEVVQPMPSAAPCGEQYMAPSWSSSPPSAAVPPSKLFGLGLYEPRPPLTMLAPGRPMAQMPRGSIGESPARSSATRAVFDVPSVMCG